MNPNDEMRTVSILKVTSTLYDPAYLQGEQTLENLWRPGESKNNARALVGQFLAVAPIYTTRESKYGVAKVNLMEEEGKEVVQYEAGKSTTEGIDAHYKMVDAIHRIIKIDPKKKTVKNAKLAVYTKDGKKVDEWTTGQHIRDLDKADVEKASRGERVVLESAYTQYTSEQLEGMYADLDKAIEKTLPEPSQEEGTTPAEPAQEEGSTPAEPEAGEEEVFTADDYINKAFEYMAVTAEELESHKQAVTEMLATLTEENVEDVRTKVHEYAKTVQEDMNKKLRDEAEDLSGVYLEKNEHSSGGYTLIEIAKNGTMKYIDIDEFGDEANHRVSGLVAGETYVLKELQAPFGYINAPAMEFVADGYTDLKLTMIDQFVLEQSTDVVPVNPLVVAGIAGVLLLAGGAIILVRKKRLA